MILEKLSGLINIYKNRIISALVFIIIINISGGYLSGCSNKAKKVDTNMNEVVEEIKNTQFGVFTKIVYASKDRLILYGVVGLIVYDIQSQKIYRAINLKSINMNYIQGDTITVFNVKEDGSQIIMYNDYSDDKSIYLYDVENDTLEKTNTKNFTNEYKGAHYVEYDKEGINYYEHESVKKYEDMECNDYAFIDNNNICFSIHPKEESSIKGISHMQILMVNMDTNEEKTYSIFN